MFLSDVQNIDILKNCNKNYKNDSYYIGWAI